MRPHQGLGHGEGGEQREEERGTSIWRDFHSVSLVLACCHTRCKRSSPALVREAWSGGRASCLGWLSLPLLADLSLFFPFSQCHSHCHFRNSLQITRNYIYNYTGYLGIAGAVVPANFRGTRTSFELPLRGSPKFCYFFRAPDVLYFPGIYTVCTPYIHRIFIGGYGQPYS